MRIDEHESNGSMHVSTGTLTATPVSIVSDVGVGHAIFDSTEIVVVLDEEFERDDKLEDIKIEKALENVCKNGRIENEEKQDNNLDKLFARYVLLMTIAIISSTLSRVILYVWPWMMSLSPIDD